MNATTFMLGVAAGVVFSTAVVWLAFRAARSRNEQDRLEDEARVWKRDVQDRLYKLEGWQRTHIAMCHNKEAAK